MRRCPLDLHCSLLLTIKILKRSSQALLQHLICTQLHYIQLNYVIENELPTDHANEKLVSTQPWIQFTVLDALEVLLATLSSPTHRFGETMIPSKVSAQLLYFVRFFFFFLTYIIRVPSGPVHLVSDGTFVIYHQAHVGVFQTNMCQTSCSDPVPISVIYTQFVCLFSNYLMS